MTRLLRLAVAVAATLVVADAAMAQGKCQFVRVVEWPVRMVRSKILVDGAINGKSVGIVLDTGATRSLVVRATAARLELPRHEAPGIRMFGVGGETKAEIAVIDELTLGKAPLKGVQFLVAGEGDWPPGMDVLLGEDFLQNFDLEFDLAHNAVRLYQPKDCDSAWLAYWTKDVVGEVEIERIDSNRAQIQFQVHVNDKPIDAELDSGASSTILTKAQAEALGVTPDTPGTRHAGTTGGLGARTVDWYVGSFKSFAIGNESIPDVRLRFADLYKDQTYSSTTSRVIKNIARNQPMLIGADFLRAHRVLVAHSQRKMYFSYAGGPVFDTGERAVGPR
jgi:predicted aspartyl protease